MKRCLHTFDKYGMESVKWANWVCGDYADYHEFQVYIGEI